MNRQFFKKLTVVVAVIIFFSFFIENSVFAAIINSADDVYKVLGKIVTWMYRIFFFASIFFVLLAAFKFLFAKDSAEEIAGASKSLMWAAVATIIALLSVGFGKIIESFITP